MKKIAFAFVLCALGQSSIAQNKPAAPKKSTEAPSNTVAKIQGWSVIKITDKFTDAVSCTAVFDKHDNVYLTPERFVVNMSKQGGIKAYQHRFDKEPASSFAAPLPSDGNERWWFGDMERVSNTQRFLFRAQTLLGAVHEYEIDLRPAKALIEVMNSDKCKG